MVKLDIISGFLGSGKTTLIQQILNALEDERVVIIENEFGQMQIDTEVLRVAGFDIYELTNGCVCCTLKDDFRLTLNQILEQKVDRIIFEPSGIFVLSEIFDLLKDKEIASRCTLNSVVTVVDAVNFHKNASGITNFFVNQIKSATSLVISKTQLVNKEQVYDIIKELQEINRCAPIISEDWENLTYQQLSSLVKVQEDSCYQVEENPSQGLPQHSSGHGFDSVGFATKKVFQLEELKQRLHEVKEGVYGKVIRSKGLVCGGENYWEFSYVYGDFAIKPYPGIISGAVTFIGKELKAEELKQVFGL